MKRAQPQTVTQLLAEARRGDEEALDRVLPLVYEVLRRLSHRELQRAGDPPTLSTTDLVHEAYLKLAPGTSVEWEDRNHFFAVAARAMRQVLVDRARRRETRRDKGVGVGLTLGGRRLRFPLEWDELLALDQALDRLAILSERLHSVVELRYFGGLTDQEVAEILGISTRTVRRDWRKARLILRRELHPEAEAR